MGLARFPFGSPSARAALTEPEEPPIVLSEPGGQGLDLTSLDLRLAAHGPLALTQLEMVFTNPQDRRIEGKFCCLLPAGATLSRFAKEVDGRLVEGEVVERLRATQVYTEILHTMQDPALLEQDQGNRFKARIFPIPARGTVRLVLSYSSVNPVGPDGRRKIVVPMRGMPRIGQFRFLAVCRPVPGESVELADGSGATRALTTNDRVVFADEARHDDFTPKDDLVLAFRPGGEARTSMQVRAGDFVMSVFRPEPAAARAGAAPAASGDWTVLVDTSASQASSGPARLRALARVLEELSAAVPGREVTLEAFDLDVAPIARWRAGEAGKIAAAVEALSRRRFLGATDLARALRNAGEAARRQPPAASTVVLVTDGIPTLGTRDTGELVRALGSWPAGVRLHVLVIGSVQDESVTAALARAGKGRVVALPLTTAFAGHAKAAVDELTRPPGADYQVHDEGAEWIEPREFRDVREGVELVAFSRLKAGSRSRARLAGGKGAELRAEGEPVTVESFAPLLEREAYRAQLALLERQEAAQTDRRIRTALRARRLEISVARRVLCPLTALLVLESERDYARYGIDRRALADVMVVGPRGIELVKRAGGPPVPPVPPVPPGPPPRTAPRRDRAARRLGTVGEALEHAPGAPPGPAGAGGIPSRGAADDADLPSATDGESESSSGERQDVGELADLTRSYVDKLSRMAPDEREQLRTSLRRFTGATGRAESAPRPARMPRPRPAMEIAPAAPPPPPAPPAPPAQDAASLDPRVGWMDGPEQTAVAPTPPAAAPPGKPAWIQQATWKPDAASIDRLRARIASQPMDRAARNSLAYGLARLGQSKALLDAAFDWQPFDPENPMVYEYAADAFAALRDPAGALRAVSSIADVSPGDSGLLNRAGYLALRADQPAMAEALFRFAIERRPDHANNYRGLALALWVQERFEDACKAYADALARDYHGRYGHVQRILREEAGLVLRAWLAARPAAAGDVRKAARALSADPAYRDDLRVTLHWETDANDVDLHIVDPAGEECYYSHRRNASGLELYEDLTQGLGPETASVPTGRLARGAYHVGVTYFSAGPMGVSRGVVVIQHPASGPKPDVQIETFCLLPEAAGPDTGNVRHVAVVEGRGGR
jgi:tetratricopeptide (TPR) repeat protein